MGAVRLGFMIILVAFLARFATNLLEWLAGALFFPAVLVGGALIVVGVLTGGKALGGSNRSSLP